MNWKGHLKWGFIGNTILLIGIVILYIIKLELFELINIFNRPEIMIFGFTIPTVTIAYILGIFPTIFVAYIVGIYASLFPDVDIGTSKAFKITYMILIILTFYCAYTEYLIGVCVSLAIMFLILGLKHRKIMHKWYTGVILGTMFIFLFGSILIGVFFIVGFLIHLACDRRKFDD